MDMNWTTVYTYDAAGKLLVLSVQKSITGDQTIVINDIPFEVIKH